jgi:hypothetical protein
VQFPPRCDDSLVLTPGFQSNGQSLAQITNGKLCFTVCIVIWAFLGMVVGQIRSLNNFSILANSSVWREYLLSHRPPLSF